MFDVVYFDRARHAKVLAAGLPRESAVQVACSEARRRRVGRMFLAGSDRELAQHELIAIVDQRRQAA